LKETGNVGSVEHLSQSFLSSPTPQDFRKFLVANVISQEVEVLRVQCFKEIGSVGSVALPSPNFHFNHNLGAKANSLAETASKTVEHNEKEVPRWHPFC